MQSIYFYSVALLSATSLSVNLNYLQRPGWLRHTAEVMQEGFKEKYKWWATVELGRRVLLLLFIVPFPGNEVC